MTPPVKIYTLSTCSHCKATKKFLNDCAVKYEFTDVDLIDPEERAAGCTPHITSAIRENGAQ